MDSNIDHIGLPLPNENPRKRPAVNEKFEELAVGRETNFFVDNI